MRPGSSIKERMATIRKGDVFRDRGTGHEREVLRVVTHHGDREVRPYADCIGERNSRIRLDRLANPRLFERVKQATAPADVNRT